MTIVKAIIIVVLLLLGYFYLVSPMLEGWATSPGTLDQLAAGSAYYPFWQYSYGYRYPDYRYMYPYYERYPYYQQMPYWPRPYGYYNLW